MGAAAHLRLQLVEIARIEGREDHVPVLVGERTAPSMNFLPPESMLSAVQRAAILSSIFSPFMFWVVPTASKERRGPHPSDLEALHGAEDEMRHVGRRPDFSIASAAWSALGTEASRIPDNSAAPTSGAGQANRGVFMNVSPPLLITCCTSALRSIRNSTYEKLPGIRVKIHRLSASAFLSILRAPRPQTINLHRWVEPDAMLMTPIAEAFAKLQVAPEARQSNNP